MWSRGVLKRNAIESLRNYYWPAVLICLISAILSGTLVGSGSQIQLQLNRSNTTPASEIQMPDISSSQYFSFFALFLVVSLIVFLAVTLFSIFVGNIITVGKLNYFLESRYQMKSAGVGRLFCGFSEGHYLNIMKCMFFRDLFIYLWTLLLVIPGIYKRYEYYMVPYLIAEYPDMDRKEAFQRSKEMMDGNKLATWILELSFIGWLFLGSLACGVGVLFVNPYYEATFMELYLTLKQNVYGTVQQANADVIDSYYTMQ